MKRAATQHGLSAIVVAENEIAGVDHFVWFRGARENGRPEGFWARGGVKENGNALPGHGCTGQLPRSGREALEGPVGQQHSADGDCNLGRGIDTAGERGPEANETEHQPSARDDGKQSGGGIVHVFGRFEVALERLVFARVPAIGRELCEAGAMADHALHQIVGHGKADVGPGAIAAIIPS